MNRSLLAVVIAGLATPLAAGEAEEAFVEANILGIFYHELGHALIDTEALPVFGQEEDAADVFSILLVDALYEDEAAQSIAYDVADGFLGEAALRDEHQSDVAWWDVHGPDEQRFYNTVCLFYGADPEAREAFAADMDLPQERADYCYEEFSQAYDSWGAVLDDMAERTSGHTMIFSGNDTTLTAQIIAPEVAALNEDLRFSQPITVKVEACNEANAFYDPETLEIIMCLEFEEHLFDLAALLEAQ